MSTKSVTVNTFVKEQDTERTWYIDWTNPSNTSSVTVTWTYKTRDGNSFVGSRSSQTTSPWYSSYSPPENAVELTVSLKPNSKTYKKKGKTKKYYTGSTTTRTATLANTALKPETPGSPTITVLDNGNQIILRTDTNDENADKIYYYIQSRSESTELFVLEKTVSSNVIDGYAQIVVGGLDQTKEHQIRSQAFNEETQQFSDMSGYTAVVVRPYGPSYDEFTMDVDSALNAHAIITLRWPAISQATGYEIQYVVDTDDFTFDDKITTVNIENNETTAKQIQVEYGRRYYFRMRSKNSVGYSDWTVDPISGEHLNCILGLKPDPPTTWSSDQTIAGGGSVILYWTHNGRDNSGEYSATISLYFDNSEEPSKIITVEKSKSDRENGVISSYTIDTSLDEYSGVSSIKWAVRTQGLTEDYTSDNSIEREIKVLVPPTVSVSIDNGVDIIDDNSQIVKAITNLPIDLSIIATPETQIPLNYYIEIVSNDLYSILREDGEEVYVNVGEVVYSKNLDISEHGFKYKIGAGSDELIVLNPDTGEYESTEYSGGISLESDASYTINVTVTMDSGLTATDEQAFSVRWEDYDGYIDADVTIDEVYHSASITPYCLDAPEIDEDDPDYVPGYNRYDHIVPNVTMSVYRREVDGSYTKVSSGIPNDAVTTTVDPHPALDFARYRIVSVSETTGLVHYVDLPDIEVGCKSFVIQWDENRRLTASDYDPDSDEVTDFGWNGNILELPYNIDVTENYNQDVELINYIGRKYPVSYRGTNIGTTASWKTDIAKSDRDTLNTLRALAIWNGDCYVREPYGTGYQASITVSIDIKHATLIIPVSLSVTRVEGEIQNDRLD